MRRQLRPNIPVPRKTQKSPNRLSEQLERFDGKETAVLEAILLELEPSPETLDELLPLVPARESPLTIGSTWLLKALLEEGLVLDAPRVAELGRCLDRVTDDWSRLHICQAMRFFSIPARNAAQFARLLESSSESTQKFLRAWAIDGFWRLGQQHDRYLPRALVLIEQGSNDAAASVRARVRNIQKKMDRT